MGEEHPDFKLGSSSLADILKHEETTPSIRTFGSDVAQLVWDFIDLLNKLTHVSASHAW